MAKKRKSTDVMPQAAPIQKPASQLSEDLASLCRDAAISLPYDSMVSPLKGQRDLRYRIQRTYQLLWYKNKPALENAISDFFRSLPSTPNSSSELVKLELLLEKLKGPAEATKIYCTTPQALRTVDIMGQHTQRDEDPPSPTPVRGIRSHFAAAKPGATRARNQESDSTTYYSAKATLPAQANISFATTATKSTDRSFQSSVGTGTQETAFTSFSSQPPQLPPKRESDYLSSLSTTECGELLRQADEVETSSSQRWRSGRSGRRLFPSPAVASRERDTQTTWGSSIATSVFDEVQRDVDQYIANGYRWPSQLHDTQTSADEDVEMEDLRVDSPKRQRLDRTEQAEPMFQSRFHPSAGFAQLEIPEDFSHLPFHVQWEAQRLSQTGVKSEALMEEWKPQTLSRLYEIASQQAKPFRKSLDAQSRQDLDVQDLTYTGQLEFAKSSNGALFDMKLKAPRKDDTSDLQRRFGSDRILYVDMPSLNKPPVHWNGKNLMGRFQEMARMPQTFLGRRWFLLLVQVHKKKKKFDPQTPKPGASRLVFVAIDNECSLYDVVSYVVPYHENADQAARKLYSRFELVVSGSTPAITFAPQDIDYNVEDQYATSDPADTRFLDPALRHEFEDQYDPHKVMSDGCCEMSFYTACKVAEALGSTDIPSAIQCRIAGSKGIWYRAPDQGQYIDQNTKPPGPHLRIARSQIKVKRHSLNGCHPGMLTLNVLKANSPARTATFHVGFWQILLDRGVPRSQIFDVVQENVRNNFEELNMALTSTSPMLLRRWMHARNELWEERNRNGGIKILADFPVAREERIVQMLEAGFLPTQDGYLAGEVASMIEDSLKCEHKHFKIPLARSTTLTGIADRSGSLQPGEVHVHFSAPFRDKASGMVWPTLSGMEGLVARNPAMAPWDIQKVRFVFRPELAHLPDMVIFSAKGNRPLAELLQGGDYDGDTFWLCWDPRLVGPFKNAPAPCEPPAIETFGIKKDVKKLRDFVKDPRCEAEWCGFFSEMALTRLRFNLLGVVTRLHERLTYLQGRIDSEEALQFVHLHDYLVDSDKQGYDFSETALGSFKKKIDFPKHLPLPLHWEFTKIDDDDDEKNPHPTGTVDVKNNIIDDVFFKLIRPMAERTIHRVKQILNPARKLMDPHLGKFFEETWESAGKGTVIRNELEAIDKAFGEIREFWKTQQRRLSRNEMALRMKEMYDQISPQAADHPTVIEWERKQGYDMSIYDKLKASGFALLHYKTNQPGRLAFLIAGRQLCILKHHEVGPSHAITEEAWCNLKLSRRPREIEVLAGDDEDDDEEETEAEPIDNVQVRSNYRGGYF